MTLTALLLDLDGTIADSLPVLFEVYRGFLAQYGLEGTREEFQSLNGPSIKEAIGVLRRKYSLEPSPEELYGRYCGLFRDHYSDLLRPFPGTYEFLDFIQEHRVPVALVTSSPRVLAESFLESQKLTQYFSEIITSDDVSTCKPSPEPYLKALEVLGVEGGDALVVEDSIHGVHAGLQAGIPTIMIHHRPHEGSVPGGILAAVESWEQLRRLIENRVVYA